MSIKVNSPKGYTVTWGASQFSQFVQTKKELIELINDILNQGFFGLSIKKGK